MVFLLCSGFDLVILLVVFCGLHWWFISLLNSVVYSDVCYTVVLVLILFDFIYFGIVVLVFVYLVNVRCCLLC